MKDGKHFKFKTNKQAQIFFLKCIHNNDVELPDDTSVQSQSTTYSNIVRRTYSFFDLLQLKELAQLLNEEKQFTIENRALIRIYEGHTIFSIFASQEKLFEHIAEKLKETKFRDEKDIFGNRIQNSFIRKLSIILNMPTEQNMYEPDQDGLYRTVC